MSGCLGLGLGCLVLWLFRVSVWLVLELGCLGLVLGWC